MALLNFCSTFRIYGTLPKKVSFKFFICWLLTNFTEIWHLAYQVSLRGPNLFFKYFLSLVWPSFDLFWVTFQGQTFIEGLPVHFHTTRHNIYELTHNGILFSFAQSVRRVQCPPRFHARETLQFLFYKVSQIHTEVPLTYKLKAENSLISVSY